MPGIFILSMKLSREYLANQECLEFGLGNDYFAHGIFTVIILTQYG